MRTHPSNIDVDQDAILLPRDVAVDLWAKGDLEPFEVESITTEDEIAATVHALEGLDRTLTDQQAARQGDVDAAIAAADADPRNSGLRAKAATEQERFAGWLPKVRKVQRHVVDTLNEARTIRDGYQSHRLPRVLAEVKAILDGADDPQRAIADALHVIGDTA